MDFRGIKIGKRSVIISALTLIIGPILFFNSNALLSLVQKTLALTVFVGLLTLITENFSSCLKIFGIWTTIALVMGGGGIVFLASGQMCTMDLVVEYKMAENPLTGEIVHKRFAGSGTPSCRDFRFPWYYQEVSDSEIQNYCKNNPGKGYCERNVESIEPTVKSMSGMDIYEGSGGFMIAELKNVGNQDLRIRNSESKKRMSMYVHEPDVEAEQKQWGFAGDQKEITDLKPNQTMKINTTVKYPENNEIYVVFTGLSQSIKSTASFRK